MDLPAISIKVKGMEAINALGAKGLANCGNLNGVAGLGKCAGLHLGEVETVGVATKSGKLAAIKVIEAEGGHALLAPGCPALQAGAKGGAKAGAKVATLAGKGGALGSFACFGLGPWGLFFLASTLGLGALAYYYYRKNSELPEGLEGQVPPV